MKKNRLDKIATLLLTVFIMLFLWPADTAVSESTATMIITVTLAEVGVIEATITFKPDEIKKQMNRKYIQGYIELPPPYTSENIKVETIRLTEVNGTALDPPLEGKEPYKIGDKYKDGVPDLRCRILIRDLVLETGENSFTITGDVIEPSSIFRGTGTLFLR